MNILGNSIFSIIANAGLPPPKTVLQVGASAGQEIDEFYEFGVSGGLFIEPLDLPFSLLVEKCKGKENYFPVQALALSEDNLKAEFFIASNAGQSSSILKPLKHLDYFPSVHFDNELSLVGYSINSIAKISKASCSALPDIYDLFYLDVQGAELEVMKGSTLQLQRGKYVLAEICDVEGYHNNARFVDLLMFLRAFGYKPIALQGDCSSGYGDCLFSKSREFLC
jgi:FkbM family methyltransferase